MPLASEIYQEGLRLPPVRLVRGGAIGRRRARALPRQHARRRRAARRSARAARRACASARRACARSSPTAGAARVGDAMRALQDYSERLMRATLRALPSGTYRAVDYLDDDGIGQPNGIRIAVAIAHRRRPRATSISPAPRAQVRGGINANFAVTLAAVYYVFRALARSPIPPNAGFMRPIRVVAPAWQPWSTRSSPPRSPAATSRPRSASSTCCCARSPRALPDRIPAASCGSMNNLAFGGTDCASRPTCQRAAQRDRSDAVLLLRDASPAAPAPGRRAPAHRRCTRT